MVGIASNVINMLSLRDKEKKNPEDSNVYNNEDTHIRYDPGGVELHLSHLNL